MTTTTPTQDNSYLHEEERVFAFRVRTDTKTDIILADELSRRADALRNAEEIPVDDRRSYDRIVRQLRGTDARDNWTLGRIARRMWITGECHWHASWVLFGSKDGSGCDCAPCRASDAR